MYTATHLDEHTPRPPYPEPVPRPGLGAEPAADAASPASAYAALEHVPAVSLVELREWLST